MEHRTFQQIRMHRDMLWRWDAQNQWGLKKAFCYTGNAEHGIYRDTNVSCMFQPFWAVVVTHQSNDLAVLAGMPWHRDWGTGGALPAPPSKEPPTGDSWCVSCIVNFSSVIWTKCQGNTFSIILLSIHKWHVCNVSRFEELELQKLPQLNFYEQANLLDFCILQSCSMEVVISCTIMRLAHNIVCSRSLGARTTCQSWATEEGEHRDWQVQMLLRWEQSLLSRRIGKHRPVRNGKLRHMPWDV